MTSLVEWVSRFAVLLLALQTWNFALPITWHAAALALAIGACTAIFSVVDGVLLRSLPYPEAERIVQLRELNPAGKQIRFAEPNFLDVRARSRT